MRAAADDAVRDHAARDRAEPRDLEERAHLGLAEDLLGRDRREHPDERLLDVLGELVDDAVGADVDALALGELPRLGARPDVEADHERVRRRCEVDVVLGDPADAGVDHVDPHLGVLDLPELADERLDRALHVALEDDVEVLDGARLHLLEERLERHAGRLRALRELLAAEALGALLGEVLRLALVLDDARQLARGRRAVEAEDLDGLARARPRAPSRRGSRRARAPCRRRRLRRSRRRRGACRAGRASSRPGPRRRRAATRRSARRPLPSRSRAGRARRPRRGGSFSSRSSRLVCCFAETCANCVVPPQSSGCSPSAASSLLTRSGFASGTSILLIADDDRHLGRARVADRLLRLRHHAVVGGDDEHGDVGHLRAAGAHRRERLVARRVEERELPAVDLGLVRADVLRDPAGLGLDDRGRADRVEQRRLAVVDVAHDRDDRRAGGRGPPRRPRRSRAPRRRRRA